MRSQSRVAGAGARSHASSASRRSHERTARGRSLRCEPSWNEERCERARFCGRIPGGLRGERSTCRGPSPCQRRRSPFPRRLWRQAHVGSCRSGDSSACTYDLNRKGRTRFCLFFWVWWCDWTWVAWASGASGGTEPTRGREEVKRIPWRGCRMARGKAGWAVVPLTDDFATVGGVVEGDNRALAGDGRRRRAGTPRTAERCPSVAPRTPA